jgi:hypothetical protein
VPAGIPVVLGPGKQPPHGSGPSGTFGVATGHAEAGPKRTALPPEALESSTTDAGGVIVPFSGSIDATGPAAKLLYIRYPPIAANITEKIVRFALLKREEWRDLLLRVLDARFILGVGNFVILNSLRINYFNSITHFLNNHNRLDLRVRCCLIALLFIFILRIARLLMV